MSKVAIIGYSFRFPLTDTASFWDDLLNSRNLVTTVEPGRWSADVFHHPGKTHPGTSYTFAAGSLGDVSGFDADFFGISPREAALMDPQHRLLLELSWETLENAGVKPSSLSGSRCGVFIGIASTDYSYRLADDLAAIDAYTATGNTASTAANRLSYFLNLRGPSMIIDTACSSSLVAFHQACRSIISGESTQALVGGVSLHLHPYGFIIFSKASMLSKRGRCRVFDESADGYVRSEGGGLFFIKDYAQAVADGDPILAVVAHSAINTDGHKSGFTVPNYQAQAELLAEAYAQAGITPTEIDYIEAHGTGTAVGDPIETRALGESLGQRRAPDDPLLIGSVKSNLGHLEAASGVAGLVKALHCIRHRTVPATIGIESPNPHIPFDEWNLKVVTQNRPLRETGTLTVGVNSFGFGGANAHVILQSNENPAEKSPKSRKSRILPFMLSASSTDGLKATAKDFSAFLQHSPALALYDVAYTAAFRREWLEHRAVVFGASCDVVAEELRKFANGEGCAVEVGSALKIASGVAFIYSGNGAQWFAMGGRLLKNKVFRNAVRRIDAIFRRYADYSVEDDLVGKNGQDRYEHTEFAQPALFAVQVGVTEMLRQSGVHPCAVAGHSVGEVAAAWACGALSLEAAVKVVYHRSKLQETTKGSGQMTAVGQDAQAVRDLLHDLGLVQSVCISGINSPKGVTVAGSTAGLSRMEDALAHFGLFYKRLELDYAFHSPTMDGLEQGVKQSLSGLETSKPVVPFYSTVTGNVLAGEALDAEYWWHNVRQPVLFEQAVKNLLADGFNVCIEVGPHPVLRTYVNDCFKEAGVNGRVIPTVMRGDDDPARVMGAVAQAMIAGVNIDWRGFFPSKGAFVALPSYPWQRERHWHPLTSESLGTLYRKKCHPLLGYPLPQHDLTWENQIDTQTHPALADHAVGGATVFPGAGFAELALASALAWHPGSHAEIEELEICSPLLLSAEHSKLVRVEVDGQDGAFAIKAREHAGSEPFVLHVTGRILRDAGGILLREDAPVLPKRKPDFDSHEHQAMTRLVGLSYGPAFLSISHGWVEGNSALALYRIAEILEPELDHHHLHPSLLDSAFQLIFQILKNDRTEHEGIAFVPVKLGKIVFRTGSTRPHLAVASLRRHSPHSLLADFTIFDASGLALAFIKDVRFRSIRLHKGPGDQLRYLECRSIPKSAMPEIDASPSLSFALTLQTMKEAVRHSVLKGIQRRYSEEVDPLLDSLCSRFTLESIHPRPRRGSASSGTASYGFAPFLSHLLAMAQEDGLVEFKTGITDLKVLASRENQVTAQDIWNSLINDYPDYFKIIHAVGRVGMHLQSLLDGGVQLQSVCHTDISALVRQALGADCRYAIGKAMRSLVATALNCLPEGQRIGVLEVCEGPPLFALDLCLSLDFDRVDFGFASTNPESLEEARRLREKFPAIGINTIAAADLGQTDAGEPRRLFQLAIVLLDFMDAGDALRALEYVATRLMPGASIVFLGQHGSRWIDFLFGGRPGWWSEPAVGGLGSRQQPMRFWKDQMERMGFSSTTLLEFYPDNASGSYLLVGQFDGTNIEFLQTSITSPVNWLILTDEQGYPAALAERLRKKMIERGASVKVISGSDIGQILLDAQTDTGTLDGIVHLVGLNALPPPYEESFRGVRHQIDRCQSVASLIKACESIQTSACCWIVTAGAMADTLPNRHPSAWRTSTASFGDASLWGFARTLANETPKTPVCLIDLEDPFALETAVAALDREFLAHDGEQEVVITATGGRFVPRLKLKPPPGVYESAAIGENSVLRLGFQMPGQLRNLRWEKHPRTVPGSLDLEVEVRATGLNFRDVMYALGMLSDEAVENGFAGPSLGLEFAGIVRTVGSGIIGFAPGDHVVGFGPSSFSNRVVTRTNAIAHIPPGLSFESAATIPSAFFTAYYALRHLARLGKGEKVLIHGAAGGVGIAAIQVAKWCGAEIFATAGSDEKRDFLRLLGIEQVFDSRSLAFADEILLVTGGTGVDVVLNSLAGEAINRNLRVLKPFGRFLELGKRDFYENTRIGLRPFRNNISYFGIDADQLMSEQPHLTGQLFGEIMALFAEGVLYPLPYHTFEAEDVVDAFRYMQQSKQIGKIVVTYHNGISSFHPDSRRAGPQLRLSSDGAYLVTGGLGGFGLKTAQWLVEKGVRQLILVSRQGLVSDESKQSVAAMESRGVQVLAAACDVTDKGQLSALLQDAAKRFSPLRGIVHSAMVIDDALIRNMDEGQIRRVFAPKILGAQNLHELTLGAKLDFFVLFSSATTLFGNPGQANYIAANTWLEALARYRRGLGLPATSVLWGALGDTGFLARNEKARDALQNRMGGAPIHSSVALDVLERLLLEGSSGEGVLDFDWKALSRFLPNAGKPKFSELALHVGEVENAESSTQHINLLLADLPDEELLDIFVNMLKQEVGEILRVSLEKIDAFKSLHLMGLDSLMGVELAVALESRFGIRLPVMALSESPSIDKLAVRILAQLRGKEEADATAAEQALGQVRQVITQHAADVPEDVITRIAEDLTDGRTAYPDQMPR